jgi:hypothetical protein
LNLFRFNLVGFNVLRLCGGHKNMKINVIRNLILPWMIFFGLSVLAVVIAGVSFHLEAQNHPIYFALLGAGVFICLLANLRTLSKAGIWIAHSLPSSLRYNSKPWIFRAFQVAVVALGFYLMGQFSWVPLFWQAFIIPIVFTLTLFVGIWSLMGPLLTWSSQMSFSRAAAFVLSLPVFALVPVTAMFLGQTIVTAYAASRPEPVVIHSVKTASKETVADATPAPVEKSAVSPEVQSRAEAFRELAESGKICSEQTKEIQAALEVRTPEPVAYWAIRAIKCSDMRSVVALPKLAKLMIEHQSPKVRAAAIRALPRFGAENVHRIAYLLIKRIQEKESAEVIEAASSVLIRLAEEDRKSAFNRLKSLLDTSNASQIAAKVLIQDLKRDDLVAEYVAENLSGKEDARLRAVGMICQLPKAQRAIAEPQIQQIVASIHSGDENDPAIQALDCMGQSGFQAIRQEVMQPEKLERPVAARALSEMDVKSAPDALKTAETCVRDENEEVRNWCSQSLGKIGAAALPQILELLKSKNSDLKNAGRNALNFFDDPAAKGELEKIRADNSGWMANKKKLQIAEAVSTALMKIENDRLDSAGSKVDDASEKVEK